MGKWKNSEDGCDFQPKQAGFYGISGKNRRSPLFQKKQLLFGGNVLSLIMTNIQFSPDEKVFL